jgi:steroid 5-alpha reductase family enzyme
MINNHKDTAPVTIIDYVTILAWSIGFVIEVAADIQKFVFRCNPANKGQFITAGIWSYSRHPNYFGEILMWFSLAICVTLSNQKFYWCFLSPAFTAFLLLKLSGVPMVEKAGEKKWGHLTSYRFYMANTNCLIPWFPGTKLVKQMDVKRKDE